MLCSYDKLSSCHCSVHVLCLFQLCLTQTCDKESVKRITDLWFGDLLKLCDEYLSSVILNEDQCKCRERERERLCERHDDSETGHF